MTFHQSLSVRRAIKAGDKGTITANLATHVIATECITLGWLELTGESSWFVVGQCPIARITQAGIEALKQYDLENLLEAQDEEVRK